MRAIRWSQYEVSIELERSWLSTCTCLVVRAHMGFVLLPEICPVGIGFVAADRPCPAGPHRYILDRNAFNGLLPFCSQIVEE